MHKLSGIATVTSLLFLAACASGSGNPTISIGMGSFGGSGGVSGSVTTEIPVDGSNDETPLPNSQLYLSDAVIEDLFADKAIPFTADADALDKLDAYAESTPAALTDENLTRIRQCLDGKAKCRVQRVE